MFRKCFAVILVLMMLTGTAMAQELCLDVEFGLNNPEYEKSITFSVLFREEELLVLSNLFPSYAVAVAEKVNTDDFFSGLPADVTISLEDAGWFTARTFDALPLKQVQGFYSGDLFEDARSRISSTFSVEELLSFMQDTTESGMDNPAAELFGQMFSQILNGSESGFAGAELQVNIYDEGKYVTLNLVNGEDTIGTLSLDYSVAGMMKGLFGYAEGGKNWYWEAEVKEIASNQLQYSSRLLADPGKKGYRAIKNSSPVLESTWTVSTLPASHTVMLNGAFVPSSGAAPVVFSGEISMNEKPALSLEAYFNGAEDTVYSVSAKVADSVPDAENKNKVSVEDLMDPEKLTSFTSEIGMRGLLFFTTLIRSMPAEYQKLIADME